MTVFAGVSNNARNTNTSIHCNNRSSLGTFVHHHPKNNHQNQWSTQGVHIGVQNVDFSHELNTETDSGIDRPRFRYQLCHFPVLGLWANFRFHSHLCKMGVRIITTANKQQALRCPDPHAKCCIPSMSLGSHNKPA